MEKASEKSVEKSEEESEEQYLARMKEKMEKVLASKDWKKELLAGFDKFDKRKAAFMKTMQISPELLHKRF